jgi:hypothetical protein
LTSKQLVEQWREYSIGWWNYFKLASKRWNIEQLAGWTRRHMRKCFWQRWHNKKGRLNALRRLGGKTSSPKSGEQLTQRMTNSFRGVSEPLPLFYFLNSVINWD